MSHAAPRILRFDQPFEESDLTVRASVIRNARSEAQPDDEPTFRLTGVLRPGSAAFVDDAQDVQLRALEADFPLPADHVPEETPGRVDEATMRAELEAEWSARLEDAVLRVREEAYDAGFRTAREELEATITDTQKSLLEDANRLRESLLEQIASLEQIAVRLALDAAEAILSAPPTDAARNASEKALAHAVEQLAGDGAVEVVLHPIDLLRIQEHGLDTQLQTSFPGLRWHPDDQVAEGDWSARSTQAVVRRIRAEMLATLAERMGISSADDA